MTKCNDNRMLWHQNDETILWHCCCLNIFCSYCITSKYCIVADILCSDILLLPLWHYCNFKCRCKIYLKGIKIGILYKVHIKGWCFLCNQRVPELILKRTWNNSHGSYRFFYLLHMELTHFEDLHAIFFHNYTNIHKLKKH